MCVCVLITVEPFSLSYCQSIGTQAHAMRQKTKIIAKQTKSQRIYTDTDTKELNQQKHQLTTISGEITREKQTKIKQTNSEMRQNRITQQEEHSKKECKKSAR